MKKCRPDASAEVDPDGSKVDPERWKSRPGRLGRLFTGFRGLSTVPEDFSRCFDDRRSFSAAPVGLAGRSGGGASGPPERGAEGASREGGEAEGREGRHTYAEGGSLPGALAVLAGSSSTRPAGGTPALPGKICLSCRSARARHPPSRRRCQEDWKGSRYPLRKSRSRARSA